MDNQEKIPAREGQENGKKPHFGKRRPHHKHGNRRGESHANSESNMPAENQQASGAVTGATVESTEGQPKGGRPQSKNHRDNNRNDPKRKGNKPPKAVSPSEEKQEINKSSDSESQTESQESIKNDRPMQRPQRPRTSSTPKKPSALPQMDNLLIEDCPEEIADLGGHTTNTADIEQILRYDIFAKENFEIPEIIPEGKVIIVGIRFRAGGKTYFFNPGNLNCPTGAYAVVETARGLEFGEVCIGNRMVDESLVVPPLRPVVRLATSEDIKHNETNHQREAEVFRIGKEKIAEHGLDMKLVSVQYTFDDSKLLFYFTSDGRVDFRELVKDLASVFHIRIELRQIGIRDEARMLGGLGACGRPLCCSTFLSDFGQVSMKMAKEQNLSLNSTKISGCCGRLMCCLRYEHETYAEALRKLPNPGTFVNTPDGPGVVTDVLPLEEAVKVSLRNQAEAAPKKYSKQDISLQHRAAAPENTPTEDMAEPDSDD